MVEEAKKNVLQYALFRPESAIVIALSILCAGASAIFPSWFPGAWWMWLGFGAVGEAALVWSTLKDEKFMRWVFDRTFRERYDTATLSVPELRQKVQKALDYRELIVKEIERRDDTVLDDHLMDVARGMEDWVSQTYKLAQGLDNYLRDPIISRDRSTLPGELQQMREQARRPMSDSVREQYQHAVQMKESQYEALVALNDTMSKAQLQLDNTLSAMGTVYTQTKLIGNKDVSNGRSQRLQADMREQVQALRDTSSALDEVYNTRVANLANR
ncbi:MAG: hypothetical protein K1X39_13125 [Thermoflexales bacterium]|nr:hypothetical protein [Thermoflexales bacterium]